MPRYHFHLLLIATVILFDLLFVFWAVRQYRLADEGTPLAMAVGTALVTLGLLISLVRFNRNQAVLRHLLGTHARDRRGPAHG